MVKKLLVMLLCLGLVVALVGCTPTEVPPTPSGTPTETPTDTTWEGMELVVAGYRLFNDDPLNYEFAAGAEKFTADKKATVEFKVGGADGLGEDIVAAVTAGDVWDLQYAFGISVFPTAFVKKLYQPLTQYINLEDPRLDKDILEGAKWLGEYYGIGESQMQEFSYMVYNETWFKELGVKTPHELYAEGKWNRDGYLAMVAELKTKGANTGANSLRPNVIGTYMSEWDASGKVTVTYDGADNREWLGMWRKLIYEPDTQITNGNVAKREVILMEEVFPNLFKLNYIDNQTQDTLRSIFTPFKVDQKPESYLTDSEFLVPVGVPTEKIPAAVELATYMVDEKGTLVDKSYKEKLSAEDYALVQEVYKNFYFIPRFFYAGQFNSLGPVFVQDCQQGKPVSTHIDEQIGGLKAKAEEFNAAIAQ